MKEKIKTKTYFYLNLKIWKLANKKTQLNKVKTDNKGKQLGKTKEWTQLKRKYKKIKRLINLNMIQQRAYLNFNLLISLF